jgi:ubiquinone/menaquinone biosynthesis C-methylase UbiE
MLVSAERGYGIWAETYASEPNPILALESRMLRRLLASQQPKRVLDIACGTGRWSLYFRQLGADVIGLDASQPMLAQAAKQSQLAGSLILANADALPIRNNSADLILCSMSLGYFRKLADVFLEFARTAAAGATVVISDLHPAAIAAGWTRSFKKNGQKFEIEQQAHTVADIENAGQRAGLQMALAHTAYFDDSDLSSFRAAGRESLFAEVRETPALLITIWKKPCF